MPVSLRQKRPSSLFVPIGEFIGELVLRPILEIIFYGITYWIGYLTLQFLSFGSLKIAPLSTVGEKRKGKRWYQIDWSPLLKKSKGQRVLKGDIACLVGILVVAATATLGYFKLR